MTPQPAELKSWRCGDYFGAARAMRLRTGATITACILALGKAGGAA